ncbi:uncharacterized protein LOC116662588 isoform X5 [Camelus ferus]|uniref:Uncharacterized protein LOC116662588 isoform X5 n=1 Tax=Camelus ferus TaxID=419612 RepID=A0A8B8SR58_CAMFR|nr:uncharacterized protein LOC116662588 isoform X5 [Camelus ferus]
MGQEGCGGTDARVSQDLCGRRWVSARGQPRPLVVSVASPQQAERRGPGGAGNRDSCLHAGAWMLQPSCVHLQISARGRSHPVPLTSYATRIGHDAKIFYMKGNVCWHGPSSVSPETPAAARILVCIFCVKGARLTRVLVPGTCVEGPGPAPVRPLLPSGLAGHGKSDLGSLIGACDGR